VKDWLGFVTGGFAGPVCLAVTVVGIVLSVLVWRKKGARSGIRGIAWSLLPLAFYLVHALALIGRIVSAIVQFAASFVFAPETYLGVILVAAAVVLFLVSGGLPLLRLRKHLPGHDKAGSDHQGRGKASGNGQSSVPAVRKRTEVTADDDDLSDVHDILKRHGIS
jgi:membrane protein implicated in regulation of membrane protease activity